MKTLLIALAVVITGIGIVFIFNERQDSEEPLGVIATDLTEIQQLQADYFKINGKYLQVLLDSKLPSDEEGSVASKLGKNIDDIYRVDVYEEPENKWGYQVSWEDTDGKYSDGVGGLKDDKDYVILNPSVTASSTSWFNSWNLSSIDWEFPSLFWLAKTAQAAFSDNSHALSLIRANDESAIIAHGSSGDLTMINEDFTISAWINLASDPGSGVQYGIVSRYTAGTDINYSLTFFSPSAGNDEFIFQYNYTFELTRIIRYDQNLTMDGTTWYHVVLLFDNTTDQTLYLDGTLVTADSSSTDDIEQDGTPQFRIGTFQSSAHAFDGDIDDVRVWNRLLTPTEVGDLNSDPCNFDNGTNLVGWWLLDNDLTDDSGNGYTLTDINTVAFTTDSAYTCSAAAAGNFLFGVGF